LKADSKGPSWTDAQIAEAFDYRTKTIENIRKCFVEQGSMTNRKIEYRVIPPVADAAFVAQMEEVLDAYSQPYDPACPIICMDEQPAQLHKETRIPIAAAAKHPTRAERDVSPGR